MTNRNRTRSSLREFDAYADRNGQEFGGTSPPDIGVPSRTQGDLRSKPDGEAQAARIASGTPGEDATDATAAETPKENLRRISDPRPGRSSERSGAREEALERATAPLGRDEGHARRG